MAKEIIFHIEVQDAELQQLLKDLGALAALYDKLGKSQIAAGKASMEYAKTQEKILQTEKQIVLACNQRIALNEKERASTKKGIDLAAQQEKEDKKATGTIALLKEEKKKLAETINELDLKTQQGQEDFLKYREQLVGISSEVAAYEAALKSATGSGDQFSVQFSAAFTDINKAVTGVGKSFVAIKDGVKALGIKELDQLSNGMEQLVKKGENAGKVFGGLKGIFSAYENVTQAVITAKLAYKNATQLATVVQKAFNVALKSNPLGLFLTLLASAVALFASYKLGSEESTESQKDLNEALTETQALLAEAASAETMVKLLDKMDKRQLESFKKNVQKQIEAQDDLLLKQEEYNERQRDLNIELQRLGDEYRVTNNKELLVTMNKYYNDYKKNARLIKEVNETDINTSMASLNEILDKTEKYYNQLYGTVKKYDHSINGFNEKIADLTTAQNNLNISTEGGREQYKTLGEEIKKAAHEAARLNYLIENQNPDKEPVTLKPVEVTKLDAPSAEGPKPEKLPEEDIKIVGRVDQIKAKAQEAADAFAKISSALDVVEQISEARLQNELARIEEKREAEIAAVNASVLSEEEKKRQIDSINERYDKQTDTKQKAAAKREKAIAITKTIIAGAQAVAQGIAQFGPPPSPAGIAAIAAAAITTATQLALIAKQKFANGGFIPFETGGMIQGALHSQGGVPFNIGGKLMEAEGGELVVNRNIWSRPDFVKNISEMNALTGGKRFFAAGGMVPTFSPPAYVSTATLPAEGFDNDMLIKGLRGVIAEEVGSLKIVNNVVDTTSQQQRLLNIQTGASF